MRQKTLIFILVLSLCCCILPNTTMAGDEYNPFFGFTHNCENTGIMTPAVFSQSVDTYLLTVGSFVKGVTLTPQYANPQTYHVKINGVVTENGAESPVIEMTNMTSTATIEVAGTNGFYKKYTVYIQRRPSEKRTRISCGFIEPYYKKNTLYVKADLVNVTYSHGNISTYINETAAVYNHAVDPNCIFYYGSMQNPIRAKDADEFFANYSSSGSNLYRIVYIEDKIVAMIPYNAD